MSGNNIIEGDWIYNYFIFFKLVENRIFILVLRLFFFFRCFFVESSFFKLVKF